MVVCKWFLQGTCKFGSYCHYEHQIPSNYNYNAATNAKPAPAKVDVNTLVKSVVSDMTGGEKGGQWLLSSYAPFKEKPAFPGFEDQSPEEIRWGFYEAQKNGTMDQYKQQLQALLESTMVKVRALQNPSPEVINMLQNIYNSQSSISQTPASFNQQSSNIFATQGKSPLNQGSDIFRSNAQTSSSIFAGSNNMFGSSQASPAQNNIFATASPPNQNIFARSSFGGGQNNTANFGNQQQSSSNIFSKSGQNQASGNIFGMQASFGQQQSQPANIFASPLQQNAQPQTQNVFATAVPPQPSGFGQQQNAFGASSNHTVQQNVFSASTTPQNLFPASSNTISNQQNPPPNYSASIFGNHANTNLSVSFGAVASNQPVDESLYSKIDDLKVEERQWYESDTLDIENIPENPPTYEMCFKV